MTWLLLGWLWVWGIPVTWGALVKDEARVTLGWALVATLWPITVPFLLIVGTLAMWISRRKARAS